MALSSEQRTELDALMALVPSASRASTVPLDLDGALATWLGVSADDVRLKVGALLGRKDQLEDALRGWVERNPFDSAMSFLGMSALAFYQAEKGYNPRIETLVDAFYYISTCASVGYADIFAATQRGRAIASLVMIVGPSLTSNALNRPADGKTSE